MGQFNDNAYGTVTMTVAVAKNLRVMPSGVIAEAGDLDVGITTHAAAINEPVSVSFINKQGTQKAMASGAIVKGARVFTAAGGKVSAANPAGSYFRGIAMADAADEEVFELMPAMGETPAA